MPSTPKQAFDSKTPVCKDQHGVLQTRAEDINLASTCASPPTPAPSRSTTALGKASSVSSASSLETNKTTTIVTWNLNGIRSVFGPQRMVTGKKAPSVDLSSRGNAYYPVPGISEFMQDLGADILCLQETKLSDLKQETFIHVPDKESYHCISEAKKGYSGVATYAPNKSTRAWQTGCPATVISDPEGRLVQTDHDTFILLNLYCPNGGRSLEYKFLFFKRLLEHIRRLRADKGREIILTGDFNITHSNLDLFNPEEMQGCPGALPEERRILDTLRDELKFIDVFRMAHGDKVSYTFWDQKRSLRPKNLGMRIDYFWITQGLRSKVLEIKHLSNVMGSDHCPVLLRLNIALPKNMVTPNTATSKVLPKSQSIMKFFMPRSNTVPLAAKREFLEEKSSVTDLSDSQDEDCVIVTSSVKRSRSER